jgi:hypothetical protein
MYLLVKQPLLLLEARSIKLWQCSSCSLFENTYKGEKQADNKKMLETLFVTK